MPEITNEFSWSVSRNQLFQHCQRAYYYNYYGYWLGWKETAPERVRKIYILKNMKSLVLWAGGIVHDIIKKTLDGYRVSGQIPPLAAIQEEARQMMRSGWVEAVSREWLKRPKATNLFELYYGNGKSLPKTTTDALKERIYDALASFYYSDILKKMLALPMENWRSVDILRTFTINDFKIFCALDAAFVDSSDGRLVVVDWKTGGENPASLRQQLACYALFAMQEWGVTSIRNLSLNGVFLNDGGRLREYELDEAALITAKDQILSSIHAMRARLKEPEQNHAEEEDFPCCGDPSTCDQCVFKEICSQY